MRRILHCGSGNMYGGVESLLATLARRGLGRPDLEQEFALCFEGRLADELRAAGAAVHPICPVRFSRPWTVLDARRRLRRVASGRGIDVVVCHSCWPHALFAPSARRLGLPVVFWTHDVPAGTHWLERKAMRLPPDLALANSRHVAGRLDLLFPGVPREVLYCPVSPPGDPPAGTRAEVRRELGTPDDATVIVQACRFERWKGHATLVEALGRLRDRPGWVAWIVGGAQRPHEAEYLGELKSAARSLGVADRVRFPGLRADVPRLLASADVHCQPNTGPEPFGIAFVEALHAGLPVVGTAIGGALEIVDEDCGVLVPPGDAGALADALAALIDDPARRARLGAAGPARARALCDPPAILDRLSTLMAGLPGPKEAFA